MKRMLLKWLVVLLVLGMAGTLLIPRLLSRDIPPPDVSDLMYDYPVVPDEENAYSLFMDAVGHLNLPDDFHLIQQRLRNKEGVEAEAITQLLEENQQVFALIEQGLERARCLSPEVRRHDDITPYSRDWFRMGQLLELKGWHHLRQDRNEEAAMACITLLRYGNMIQRDNHVLAGSLVAIYLIDMGLDLARSIATDAATPRDVREALRHVVDEIGPFDDALERSFMTEYWMAHHAMEDISTIMKTQGNKGMAEMLGVPLFLMPPSYGFHPNRTRQMYADSCRVMISNVARRFFEQAPISFVHYGCLHCNGLDRDLLWRLIQPNGVGHILHGMLMPDSTAATHRKIQLECDLAATRLLFACIAYREDQGRNPATLNALVPDYIAAVPIDPYDGQPFRYDAARGVLYAVGPNLTDFGGLASTPNARQHISIHADKDIVYELE